MRGGKNSIEELAVFGGPPLFDRALHVGGPNVGDRGAFYARLDQMFERNWLTNDGPLVRELEQSIAAMLGVRHCVAICNGTVALEIAIRGLDLTGEVILPSFTFIATAHALWWQGVRPVFCDIDAETHCIDPRAIERHIGPRTTGILAVHTWGRPCDVDAIERVARKHGLKVLFDAAHAFAVSHGGRLIGGFGNCEVLSFHATKFFNTLEGGAIVTNDDDLAAKVRLMRNFGFAGLDNVIYIGTNGKMCEAAAAMGLTNLESLDQTVAVNRRNYLQYCAAFDSIAGIRMVRHDDSERCNFQYVVVEVDPEFGVTRDHLVQLMHAEGVRARRYFWPGCHRMEPYLTQFEDCSASLPRTGEVAQRILVLPTGLTVGTPDVERIVELVRFVARDAPAIADRLHRSPSPPAVGAILPPNQP